jgi:hypothetical protein
MIRAWIGMGALVAFSTAVLISKSIEETRLRAVIAGHDACAAAVTNGELDVSTSRCPPAVAAAHRVQVKTRTCDAALASGETFVLRSACSTEVKTVVADRDAARIERDDARSDAARLRRDQGAALARAEARGFAQAQRTHDLETRLEGDADPTADGLARCDAECLRRLGA